MAAPKEFKTGIIIDGGVAEKNGGSNTEVFMTDGTKAEKDSWTTLDW